MARIEDHLGFPLTGASDAARDAYVAAVEGFNLFRGEPVAELDRAIALAPDFVMARLLKAWLHALAAEVPLNEAARRMIDDARALPMDERERCHLGALDRLTAGEWTAAGRALDLHLAEWPRDVVALQCGHQIDFFRAAPRDLRDRIARALPDWSPDDPGYGSVLGMYAFGLEEAGDYGRAEALGREAVARAPADGWAHHAVAHVLEMEGRAGEGLDWMAGREAHWADEASFFRVHNWWHAGLFHIEIGDPAGALALYDARIDGAWALALNLSDAAALLWRLWTGGVDVGDRFDRLAIAWEKHLPGTGSAFNDWHMAIAFLGAGRVEVVDGMIARLRALTPGSEAERWEVENALPLIGGFHAFALGAYEEAADRLWGSRQIVGAFGGSHAQRDVIDWTLTEAAIRAGQGGLAAALAHERLALRPHSPINRSFLERARALP